MNVDFASLNEWQRTETSRHFQQTWRMNYGFLVPATANFFRISADIPELQPKDPPAVAVAQLRDAAAAGGTVTLPKLSKADCIRVSDLLRQTWMRAARENRDAGMTALLEQLVHDWDSDRKVPSDEYSRNEYLAVDVLGRKGGRDAARAQPPRVIELDAQPPGMGGWVTR